MQKLLVQTGKLVASVLIFVTLIVPGGSFLGLFLLLYRGLGQIYIFLSGSSVVLAPLGFDSYQGTRQQMEIRVVMEFDEHFEPQNFFNLVEKNVPPRLKLVAGTFWGLPAFFKSKASTTSGTASGDRDFSLHRHIRQLPAVPSSTAGRFRKSVQKLVADLPEVSKDRPQWEFVIIPEEDGLRTAIVFRIDHAYTDVAGIYVFLASLTAENLKAPINFYVDPCGENIHFKRPSWFFIGWGVFLTIYSGLLLIKKQDNKAKHLEIEVVHTSCVEIDLEKVKAVKKAYGVSTSSVLTSAAWKSWAEISGRRKFPVGYTMARCGRTPGDTKNSSSLCILVANKDELEVLDEKCLKTVEKNCKEAKYTSIFIDFAAYLYGPLFQSSGSFGRPPAELFICTNSPFAKNSIEIGGSELTHFYWFLRVNQAYVSFVTYDDKITSCISCPASLMTEEELQKLNFGISTNLQNMYSLVVDLEMKNSESAGKII